MPEITQHPTALITGASSGIGRAFAQQLAREGYAIIAVGRDGDALAVLGDDLGAGKAGTRPPFTPLVADLSTRAGIDRVVAVLGERAVDVLVNNAGFGVKTPTLATPVETLTAMSMVMNEAVRTLSWHAAQQMVGRGRGGIINVTSLAGVTTMGTYAAEKAAATTFTEALAGELAGTPVTCTAVLPGFVRTDFHNRMRVRDQLPAFAWLDVDTVVRQALRDARAGKVISVPSARYAVLYALSQVTPRAVVRRLSGGFSFKRKRRARGRKTV